MLWTRSLCLSALPSYRAPDEVIRTVTGVARLHCLYLAGVSVVRCQIVFTLVVYLLSVSVFQVLKLFSPGRVSVYPCRVRTGLYSLPELETLHCRVYCTCTADDICTSTVFGVCTCTASLSHLHCVLELSNKDYLFSLAIGSRAFCTVTHRHLEILDIYHLKYKVLNIKIKQNKHFLFFYYILYVPSVNKKFYRKIVMEKCCKGTMSYNKCQMQRLQVCQFSENFDRPQIYAETQ